MRRKLVHHLFRGITALCALMACGILAWLVWAIARRGLPAISWHFFTEQIKLVGASGGIFFNIIEIVAGLVNATKLAAFGKIRPVHDTVA